MRTRHVLLATLASVFAAAAAAAAAQGLATYDPAQLPASRGIVAQYSLSPRGDVDGLILADNTEVHLPPHLGRQLAAAIKPGDSVTIHGLHARSIAMIQALSVRDDATGRTVTDHGGPPPAPPIRPDLQPLSDQAHVKSALHGPRGDLNGALLDDGTIVRLPPPEAQRLAADLAPGAAITVDGQGYAGPLGRVIAADAIGPDPSQLVAVDAPPPPPPVPQ